MALAKDVALDLLTKLEADLDAHQSGGTPSVYQFAGFKSGVPVGMSKTVAVSLNRMGQVLQFLAGYYTSTTDTTLRARIAKATARTYNIIYNKPIVTNYSVPTATTVPNIETNGHFPKDPSGALLFIGLMMIDKQGVIDNPSFGANSHNSAVFVRGSLLPRIAAKADRSCYYFNSEKHLIPGILNDPNYTWATQKMSRHGLNGTSIMLGALSLYCKMYGVTAYNKAYTDSYNVQRKIGISYSNTYNTAGTLLTSTYAGQHPGSNMCIPIGNHTHSRGPFPSIGYNAFIAVAMTLQAFAEKVNTSSTFSNMKTLVTNHPLHIDALKIVNYYRDRVQTDGEIHELGAHRNYAGDASRFRTDWKNQLVANGANPATVENSFVGSGKFDELVNINNHPGRSGYGYVMTWVMPEHSFFNHLADNFQPSTGKQFPHIDYSVVGTNASVAQGFAAVGEAVSVRVAAGLGLSMLQGVTTIR